MTTFPSPCQGGAPQEETETERGREGVSSPAPGLSVFNYNNGVS